MINKPIQVIFTEARPQYGDEEIKEIFDFSGVPDKKHTEMAEQLTQLASASSKGRCRQKLQ